MPISTLQTRFNSNFLDLQIITYIGIPVQKETQKESAIRLTTLVVPDRVETYGVCRH